MRRSSRTRTVLLAIVAAVLTLTVACSSGDDDFSDLTPENQGQGIVNVSG